MTKKPTLAEALSDVAIRPSHWRTDVEQRVLCPACNGGTTRSKDLALRLDVDGGAVWKCHRAKCGWSGNIPAGSVVGGRTAPGFTPREQAPTVLPEPDAVEERPEALYDFFEKRGISRDTVDALGIYLRRDTWFPQLKGEEKESTSAIVFPYREGGELVNRKYRGYRMVEVDDGKGGKKRVRDKIHKQDKGAKKTLYNGDCLNGIGPADTLYLVEGEFDVAAILDCGHPYVVSSPEGSPDKLREESDPERANDKRFFPLEDRMEDIRKAGRIVLAGDMDGPGKILMEEYARRIGKDLVYVVNGWPEGCKDANDVLREYGRAFLMGCLKAATPLMPNGVFDGVSAVELTVHRDDGRPQPLTTGLPSLDAVFKLPQHGSLVILTGPPGSGKSSLFNALTVQAGIHHKWHSIVCSPEMGRMDTAAYMASIHAGASFYRAGGMSLSQLSDAAKFLVDHVTFLDREDEKPSLDWIIDATRRTHARKGSKILIIDSVKDVDFFASTASDPKEAAAIEKQRRAVLYPVFLNDRLGELRRLSRELGIIIVLVAHPHMLKRDRDGKYPTPTGYDIAGGAPWFDNAEVGLTIERADSEGGVRIIVWKARHKLYSAYGDVRLFFERETGRFFNPEEGGGLRLVDTPESKPETAGESATDDVPWETAS